MIQFAMANYFHSVTQDKKPTQVFITNSFRIRIKQIRKFSLPTQVVCFADRTAQ